MKNDIRTNYNVAMMANVAATDTTVDVAAINGAEYGSASFVALAGTIGTSITGKIQFTDDPPTEEQTYTDAVDPRNTAETAVDGSSSRFDVVVFEKQYARLLLTAVGICSGITVVTVAGPKRSVQI